jgi:excisionase family DNA binding protein
MDTELSVHVWESNSMSEQLAVTISKAAALAGVGRSTLYSEISKGNLRVLKVGRRSIIAMEDLRKWLASKTGEAG